MLHLWHVTVVVSHTCIHTKLSHQTQSHFWSPHQAILLSYWHMECAFFVLLLLAKSWFISFLIISSSYLTDCVWWVCSLCYCCWPKADSVSELLVLLLVCFLVSRFVCCDFVWFLVLCFCVNCNGPCNAVRERIHYHYVCFRWWCCWTHLMILMTYLGPTDPGKSSLSLTALLMGLLRR